MIGSFSPWGGGTISEKRQQETDLYCTSGLSQPYITFYEKEKEKKKDKERESIKNADKEGK